MTIGNKMRINGDKMEDVTIVEKSLWSMMPKFNYVVCSIDESKDIDSLSIDELQSSLQVHEQKMNQQEQEEQALQVSTNNHFSSPNKENQGKGGGRGNKACSEEKNNQSYFSKGRGKARDDNYSTNYKPADKSNIECYRCHRYGHYKFECRTNLKKNRGARSNFAEKEEEISLLMVCHAKEETHQNVWYLDTGCSNHMSGNKSAFSHLDESYHDTVKFGDNSTVSVMGKGKVTIQTKGSSTQTISNVLFVPELKTNLLSVGQLQEKGYEFSIKNGICRIRDEKLGLIAQVSMTANRMFPLSLHNTNYSCFSTKLKDMAWLWHFWYGHLNFGCLKTSQQKQMVSPRKSL